MPEFLILMHDDAAAPASDDGWPPYLGQQYT